ncbi:MAG: hypothetical protein TYPL_0160 [Candidatus Tyloplasma litorale]|nr:MAG: hypothetical protein TYPL_0160 [Mycoplasmatales bacterium]
MENKIKQISKKSNEFLNSKNAFVIFLGGVLFFSIINYFLFAFNSDFEINTLFGNIVRSSSNAWIGWFEITISTIGSLLTISGVILTIRFDKKFIWPLLIGEVLIIIDAIILGAFLTSFSYFLMIISAIYNYYKWNTEFDNQNKMNLTNWIIVVIFILFYIGFFTTIMFSFSDYDYKVLADWNDIISSGIVVASWYIILRKSKWGFLGFLITDITYLLYFFTSGVWASGSSYIVYLFIDSTSFISWWNSN